MQRGNPAGVRARVTDHAVRRYAERALGEAVEPTVEDDEAILEIHRRRVPVGAIRRHLSVAGGLGVANGARAVITEGLKLVIADRAVVTVLSKKWRADAAASGPSSPVPRPRTILELGAGA
ncbi:MAG: hypothetical protein INR63_06675 [Actinomycetospora chiangmaiensis]|nr:hypothetical protein [Actinomycetospora chiangmaiensis]